MQINHLLFSSRAYFLPVEPYGQLPVPCPINLYSLRCCCLSSICLMVPYLWDVVLHIFLGCAAHGDCDISSWCWHTCMSVQSRQPRSYCWSRMMLTVKPRDHFGCLDLNFKLLSELENTWNMCCLYLFVVSGKNTILYVILNEGLRTLDPPNQGQMSSLLGRSKPTYIMNVG
jgi:hypothetical protein